MKKEFKFADLLAAVSKADSKEDRKYFSLTATQGTELIKDINARLLAALAEQAARHENHR